MRARARVGREREGSNHANGRIAPRFRAFPPGRAVHTASVHSARALHARGSSQARTREARARALGPHARARTQHPVTHPARTPPEADRRTSPRGRTPRGARRRGSTRPSAQSPRCTRAAAEARGGKGRCDWGLATTSGSRAHITPRRDALAARRGPRAPRAWVPHVLTQSNDRARPRGAHARVPGRRGRAGVAWTVQRHTRNSPVRSRAGVTPPSSTRAR